MEPRPPPHKIDDTPITLTQWILQTVMFLPTVLTCECVSHSFNSGICHFIYRVFHFLKNLALYPNYFYHIASPKNYNILSDECIMI